MNTPNHYATIEREAVAEYKDRGSKFLAYAFPVTTVEEFKKRLKALKEEHPKAAHHCSAYRIGLDGTSYRASDDGEPAGSAGKPILGQLDSKGITNAGIVVVRYFGGTLLGVPGLINAYKMVSSLALQLTPVVQKPVLVDYELQFDYTLMNEVMMIVKRLNCEVLKNETQLFCIVRIGVPKESEPVFEDLLKDLQNVSFKKFS